MTVTDLSLSQSKSYQSLRTNQIFNYQICILEHVESYL